MIRIEENFSLLPFNTFGLDVKARYFVEYDSVDALCDLLAQDWLQGKALLNVGEGSNLLFLDHFDGVVLHSAIGGIEPLRTNSEHQFLRIGAGVKWDDVCAYAAAQGWGGIENLSGIPGNSGAAAVQNIGAYGVELKDVVTRVEAVRIADGKVCSFKNSDCCYGYRESIFKQRERGNYVVTAIEIALDLACTINREYGALNAYLTQKKECTIADVREAVVAIRNSKLPDPKVLGNAGSFFKNPVVDAMKFKELCGSYRDIPAYGVGDGLMKVPAAWLIEQTGWKGKDLGRAGVYERQPLVLVNRGGATGREIEALAQAIIASVKEKFGIVLQPEVNFIGA